MLLSDWAKISRSERNELLAEHEWVTEEKLDGCRMMAHVGESPGTLRSLRLVSSGDIERTANFPHIAGAALEGVPAGTVFDCEILLPTSEAETSAVVCAGPDTADLLQQEHGPAELYIFDIIRHPDIDMRKTVFRERRRMLEEIFEANAHLADYGIALVEQRRAGAHGEAHAEIDRHFEEVRAAGGEGIVLKRLDAPYIEGSRLRIAIKRKVVDTVDGWISGYTSGVDGVGALQVSALVDGAERYIGAFKPPTERMRKQVTGPDGKLRGKYCGRAVEVRGNGWTRHGCLRHLVFVRWRPDKADFQKKKNKGVTLANPPM